MKTQTQITEIPNHTHELNGVKYQSVLSPAERIMMFLNNAKPAWGKQEYIDGFNQALNIAKIWFEAEIEANKQLTEKP